MNLKYHLIVYLLPSNSIYLITLLRWPPFTREWTGNNCLSRIGEHSLAQIGTLIFSRPDLTKNPDHLIPDYYLRFSYVNPTSIRYYNSTQNYHCFTYRKCFGFSLSFSIFMTVTGKSLSEALIFASTNPQYDDIMFIELQVQYVKIPSSNLGRTCCEQKKFLTFRTIFVHNMFSLGLSLEFSCIEHVIQ